MDVDTLDVDTLDGDDDGDDDRDDDMEDGNDELDRLDGDDDREEEEDDSANPSRNTSKSNSVSWYPVPPESTAVIAAFIWSIRDVRNGPLATSTDRKCSVFRTTISSSSNTRNVGLPTSAGTRPPLYEYLKKSGGGHRR